MAIPVSFCCERGSLILKFDSYTTAPGVLARGSFAATVEPEELLELARGRFWERGRDGAAGE
jgi:hypothetical protein